MDVCGPKDSSKAGEPGLVEPRYLRYLCCNINGVPGYFKVKLGFIFKVFCLRPTKAHVELQEDAEMEWWEPERTAAASIK